MSLYQINHDINRKLWCGPGAIALVTGLPTSLIYAHADAERRSRGGKRGVQGMYNSELWAVLRACGFRVTEVYNSRGEQPTLKQFARDKASLFAARPIIVHVGDHYGVLIGRRYADNQTRDPIYVGDCTYLRSRVCAAWAVERIGKPLPAPEKPAPKPRDTTSARARSKAQALAKKHGIEIEREAKDAFWVTCPALADDDPLEGSHFAFDWVEILRKVEAYVEHLTNGYLEAVTAPPAPPPPACPATTAAAVAFVLEQDGAQSPMDIACDLSIRYGVPVTEKQVRGAAISLIQRGAARWFRNKLKPTEAHA
ncbi:hypothetical protein [Piscinibacter gummiphilus]|uniref:Peptidase C39-like domain-containing protein n=1 Tax=Piscinibacter gummiphilus TaxID=946333 RepID=A0ABZ0CNH5_9BURK|nr:hypothetical protein [Piscinibacter gummiphilus]WOB06515.1 hypothetical protein RXV79_16455 [Piscinibacter gummiphilus]